MERLAAPSERLQPHYPIVVIGSGYGGAITASRLARAGQKVCVLERGLELHPGEYPNHPLSALQQLQIDEPNGRRGALTGLYDMRLNDDIHVLQGCGLGGTSLINAGVALHPDRRVFLDARWPQVFQANPRLLDRDFARAEAMLQTKTYPSGFPRLAKHEALRASAESLGAKVELVPINVTFKAGANPAGVDQPACVGCGDCCSGCNYGSKNSILMNYLPDAKRHGAEIFTGIAARRIERSNGCWSIHCERLEPGQEHYSGSDVTIRADIVVVAAGTLGSTELLLRSKASGLSMSDEVGGSFSSNGDLAAFVYNADRLIRGIGKGTSQVGKRPVGPHTISWIDLRDTPDVNDGLIIEEGVIPAAMTGLLPEIFAVADEIIGRPIPGTRSSWVAQRWRELLSVVLGPSVGAMQRTLTYMVMTHDGSNGRMLLDQDRLRISWPGLGTQPRFKMINELLFKASAGIGGVFVENPSWALPADHGLSTVHPLGGCPMADEAHQGVVNDRGQVFCRTGGRDVYADLYVCDGSIIPRSLGVNPLLTISALAERCSALIARGRGWTIDYR